MNALGMLKRWSDLRYVPVDEGTVSIPRWCNCGPDVRPNYSYFYGPYCQTCERQMFIVVESGTLKEKP